MSPAIPANSTNDSLPDAPATPITMREVGHEAVRDPEDDRAQGSRARAPVPSLAAGDRGRRLGPPVADRGMLGRDDRLRGGRPARPAGTTVALLVEPLPDLRVLALVGGDRLDLRVLALGVVRRLLVAFEGLHEVRHGARAEDAGRHDDQADAGARPALRRDGGTHLAQPARPDVRVPALVGGDVAEGGGPPRVLLDRRELVVQDDRVLLQLEVLEALGDVHAASLAKSARDGDGRDCLDSDHDDPAAAALPHGRRRDGRDARRSTRGSSWPR